MKVIKIEIKKENLEINTPNYQEAIIRPIQQLGSLPARDDVFYEVRRVFKNITEEPINYLVKMGDNKVFEDLLQITKDDLMKEFKRGEKIGQLYYLRLFIGYVALPWYKKIFAKTHLESLRKNEKEIFNNR